jgi:hypothetical protein
MSTTSLTHVDHVARGPLFASGGERVNDADSAVLTNGHPARSRQAEGNYEQLGLVLCRDMRLRDGDARGLGCGAGLSALA